MEIIKNIRNGLGITQYEMAALLGLSQSAWSLYEIGERKLPVAIAQKLIKLANDRGETLTLDEIYADEAKAA